MTSVMQSQEEHGQSSPDYTRLEEIVRITRHRTTSSEWEDSSTSLIMQCSLCGKPTMDKCRLCKWAPYCSDQCTGLHRPIHKYFCEANFVKRFPKLTGLKVIPVSSAVHRIERNQQCLSSPDDDLPASPPRTKMKLDAVKLTGGNNLTELGLIHRRARIIRHHSKKVGGQAACAICGDTCEEFENDIHDKAHCEEALLDSQIVGKCSSGDAGCVEKDKMPQRLVRFAGMLLCTSCVEIQVAGL